MDAASQEAIKQAKVALHELDVLLGMLGDVKAKNRLAVRKHYARKGRIRK